VTKHGDRGEEAEFAHNAIAGRSASVMGQVEDVERRVEVEWWAQVTPPRERDRVIP
jgi:hypothetical protein